MRGAREGGGGGVNGEGRAKGGKPMPLFGSRLSTYNRRDLLLRGCLQQAPLLKAVVSPVRL